jgi:hypothetical protein
MAEQKSGNQKDKGLDRVPVQEMFGGSMADIPVQKTVRAKTPTTSQNGVGTTAISTPLAPKPQSNPPVAEPGTKGLGSNQIATPPPSKPQQGDKK